MQCPSCNYINAATQVRCLQCNTTLIHEAVGHSPAYHRAVALANSRIYGVIAAVIGFILVVCYFKFVSDDVLMSDEAVMAYGGVGAVVGNALGRLAAAIMNRSR